MDDNQILETETQIPEELKYEINRLRKKDKVFTWIFTGLFSAALIGGALLYAQRNSNADVNTRSASYSTGVTNTSYNGANITNAYNSTGTSALGNASGTAGAGSCCGGGASAGSASKEQLASLEKQALDNFKAKFGNQQVTAKAFDYGCHIQINIYDTNKKLIHSYAYRGGQMNLIS